MLAIIAIFGIIAAMGIAALWRAYVLSVMWSWFVVPTFALPELSMPIAYGLSLLMAMLTIHKTGNEPESDASAGQKITNVFVIAFLAPAVVLLFGWITTKFI